ncbi:MAG: tRNA (N6-threonylcarbamoyladenosine(37)-N6)-methyltransferase TrmO [Oscillospiraceae bacterium]|nr:tRNA (N6-threonylcarbamoyladenosine(37)-N6)-methyltransferase TrmO [Oscillospiraceae bacterium]
MSGELTLQPIARAVNGYAEKFGVPRQAGVVPQAETLIVFEPEFAVPEALRGLEGFSHLWLIWGFSGSYGKPWSPTVRPPRLGGNRRMGVFATRSPVRPNPLALSCVELAGIEEHEGRLALRVRGADLMSGTPVYDIKPYLAYADAVPTAAPGWTAGLSERTVTVDFPPELLRAVPEEVRPALLAVLSHDPRPAYARDGEKEYGLTYGGVNVRFTVSAGVLRVKAAEKG